MSHRLIKTNLVSAVMLTAGSICSYAEIPHMAVGYNGEEIPTSSTLGISTAGTLNAAALVDPSELGDLRNLRIMGFNVGLASRINISEITVWATESLEGTPLVSYTLKDRPVKGWNYISLDDYIDIPCQPMYIGYSITTSGASYPVAYAGERTPDGLWIDNGNGWENQSEAYDGMLGISVEITADNLPLHNLTLVRADIPSVMHSKEPTFIPIEIRNSGAMTVNGFSITCDEGNGVSQTFDISAEIKPNKRMNMDLDIVPLSSESETPIEFTVAITSVDGNEDNNPADNSISGMTRVSRFTFTKRLLVEEFTTTRCVNCPRAAELLHKALIKDTYKDRVFGVCHHSGFFTDRLTQPCDVEMEVLYGSGGTYAPAMCFDRLEITEGSVATGVPLDLYDLTSTFDRLLESSANVDLNLTAKWNSSTGEMEINVEGGSANGLPPTDANRITVYILENNIHTPEQTGGGTDYLQQHVIRAYNATWGEEIEWKDNGQFDYNVSLKLPSNIVPENMEAIGVISHHNPDNTLDCAVWNSTRAPRIDWAEWSGVVEVSDACITNEIYYDLFGNIVSSSFSGIVIKVQTLSDGTVNIAKTVNP